MRSELVTDARFVEDVISSCKDHKQMEVSLKLIRLFAKKHRDSDTPRTYCLVAESIQSALTITMKGWRLNDI